MENMYYNNGVVFRDEAIYHLLHINSNEKSSILNSPTWQESM